MSYVGPREQVLSRIGQRRNLLVLGEAIPTAYTVGLGKDTKQGTTKRRQAYVRQAASKKTPIADVPKGGASVTIG